MTFAKSAWIKCNAAVPLRLAELLIILLLPLLVDQFDVFGFVFSLVLCENAYQHIVDPSATATSRFVGCIKLFAPLVAVLMSEKPRFALAYATSLPYACFALRDTRKARDNFSQNASKPVCKSFQNSNDCPSREINISHESRNQEKPHLIPEITAFTDNSIAVQDHSTKEVLAEQHSSVVLDRQHSSVVTPHGAQTSQVDEEGVDFAALGDVHAEVEMIVRTGRLGPADERLVHGLVETAKNAVRQIVPEANVFGYIAESMARASATGRKAEIEIVATACPKVLRRRLLLYQSRPRPKEEFLETAAHVLSAQLPWYFRGVGRRRTALLTPAAHGFGTCYLLVCFSVNNPYPKYLSHILSQSDDRSEALMRLVMRWTRVRDISDATEGHLHPYGQILLVMNFLRWRRKFKGSISEKSVVDVFAEFVIFYRTFFQSHDVAGPVRFSADQDDATAQKRQSFDEALARIPIIEDPLDTSNNVADTMTPHGLARLGEELARAANILSHGNTSLTELLENYSPERLHRRSSSEGSC